MIMLLWLCCTWLYDMAYTDHLANPFVIHSDQLLVGWRGLYLSKITTQKLSQPPI